MLTDGLIGSVVYNGGSKDLVMSLSCCQRRSRCSSVEHSDPDSSLHSIELFSVVTSLLQ